MCDFGSVHAHNAYFLAVNDNVMPAGHFVLYSSPMEFRSLRGCLVVLLGLWVVLAPAYSAAPAVAMAVQTDMSDGATGASDCCPEDDLERALCKLMCLNAGQMAIALDPGKCLSETHDNHDRRNSGEMLGMVSRPEPAPPKLNSLL